MKERAEEDIQEQLKVLSKMPGFIQCRKLRNSEQWELMFHLIKPSDAKKLKKLGWKFSSAGPGGYKQIFIR